MAARGGFSFKEISTQAESWRSAIDATLSSKSELLALMSKNARRRIIFIGCGSTHYLAQYAAPFFQSVTGIVCRGVPSSELCFETNSIVAEGETPLIIALSRSGDTSETIMAVEKMRARGSDAITISCYDDTGLSAASCLTICIPAGREESFAQTRSFAGMLVAVQVLAALVANDAALLDAIQQLPGLATDIIERAEPVAQEIGPNEGFKRITYLGSGALYGLASESTVKMKEMSLSIVEPYHFMEFRHGPMSLLDEEHLIVALLSDNMRDYEIGVLRDLKQRKAYVLVIADRDDGLSEEFDKVFVLGSSLPERARGVLYLPLVQLLAYYRSMGRGLNPDRPRNVIMAIRLDGTGMEQDGG